MADLYLDGKKCVTAVIIHVDGKALMLHDQQKQCISTSIKTVKKDHLTRVLEEDQSLPPVIRHNFDCDRDPVEAAFALAALDSAATYFKLEGVELVESVKMLRASCAVTQMILDSNAKDYNMMAFSIDVDGMATESKDDLAQRFVMVDRMRIYTKPSSADPSDMDVYYMGLKMTRMTGIICLLYWNTKYV